ncbi:SET domain [Phytophthora cactorum]|nr:SET domain [Phytophthora cactorum]
MKHMCSTFVVAVLLYCSTMAAMQNDINILESNWMILPPWVRTAICKLDRLEADLRPKCEMKQLKLDSFFFRGGTVSQRDQVEPPTDQVNREGSVLQTFAEYEDMAQNVYVRRPRNKPTVVYSNRVHCTSKYKCGTQRMQRAIDADVSLEILAVKGIALAAAMPIEKDALVAQYVGKVLSRAMYLDLAVMVVVDGTHHVLTGFDREPNAHTHYGLAVDANEVIYARYAGGIARFANHSCSPNCTIAQGGEEITIKNGKAFVRAEMRQFILLTIPAPASHFVSLPETKKNVFVAYQLHRIHVSQCCLHLLIS